MINPAKISDISTDFYIPLSQLGVIHCSGEQAETYLQGQLTIDVPGLEKTGIRFCAHCDQKGKAWSLGYLLKNNNGISFITHRESLNDSLAQLQKYGVFSKVTLTDDTAQLSLYFGSGSKIENFIENSFNGTPQKGSCIQSDLGIVANLPAPEGFILLLTAEGNDTFKHWINENELDEYHDTLFEALNIQSGVPTVFADNIAQFVPQMMNVQALNGIDFKKGCYMGQEVIARTKYLGKNKRAAFILKSSLSTTDIQIGAKVEKQLENNWRMGGTIIRAAQLEEETWILAVLPNDTKMNSVLRLQSAPEIELTVLPLPYNIEN